MSDLKSSSKPRIWGKKSKIFPKRGFTHRDNKHHLNQTTRKVTVTICYCLKHLSLLHRPLTQRCRATTCMELELHVVRDLRITRQFAYGTGQQVWFVEVPSLKATLSFYFDSSCNGTCCWTRNNHCLACFGDFGLLLHQSVLDHFGVHK